jgi:hypothetical protein
MVKRPILSPEEVHVLMMQAISADELVFRVCIDFGHLTTSIYGAFSNAAGRQLGPLVNICHPQVLQPAWFADRAAFGVVTEAEGGHVLVNRSVIHLHGFKHLCGRTRLNEVHPPFIERLSAVGVNVVERTLPGEPEPTLVLQLHGGNRHPVAMVESWGLGLDGLPDSKPIEDVMYAIADGLKGMIVGSAALMRAANAMRHPARNVTELFASFGLELIITVPDGTPTFARRAYSRAVVEAFESDLGGCPMRFHEDPVTHAKIVYTPVEPHAALCYVLQNRKLVVPADIGVVVFVFDIGDGTFQFNLYHITRVAKVLKVRSLLTGSNNLGGHRQTLATMAMVEDAMVRFICDGDAEAGVDNAVAARQIAKVKTSEMSASLCSSVKHELIAILRAKDLGFRPENEDSVSLGELVAPRTAYARSIIDGLNVNRNELKPAAHDLPAHAWGVSLAEAKLRLMGETLPGIQAALTRGRAFVAQDATANRAQKAAIVIGAGVKCYGVEELFAAMNQGLAVHAPIPLVETVDYDPRGRSIVPTTGQLVSAGGVSWPKFRGALDVRGHWLIGVVVDHNGVDLVSLINPTFTAAQGYKLPCALIEIELKTNAVRPRTDQDPRLANNAAYVMTIEFLEGPGLVHDQPPPADGVTSSTILIGVPTGQNGVHIIVGGAISTEGSTTTHVTVRGAPKQITRIKPLTTTIGTQPEEDELTEDEDVGEEEDEEESEEVDDADEDDNDAPGPSTGVVRRSRTPKKNTKKAAATKKQPTKTPAAVENADAPAAVEGADVPEPRRSTRARGGGAPPVAAPPASAKRTKRDEAADAVAVPTDAPEEDAEEEEDEAAAPEEEAQKKRRSRRRQ